MLNKILFLIYIIVVFIILIGLSLVSARIAKIQNQNDTNNSNNTTNNNNNNPNNKVNNKSSNNINNYFVGFYIVNSLIMNFAWNLYPIQIIVLNIVLLLLAHFLGRNLRVLGLTGQICSGKSTVSNHLQTKHNAIVIELDRLNAEILEDSEIKRKIRIIFGDEVFDDQSNLNKAKLREIVFKDKEKLKKLEKLTHLKVFLRMIYLVIKSKLLYRNSIVAIENAILLRFNFLKYLCFPILSICTHNSAEIVRRVMNRDNCSREIAEKILEKQLSLDEFEKQSDLVIYNDTTEEELLKRIDYFANSIQDNKKQINKFKLNFI